MAGALDVEILAALREVAAGQAAVTAALTAQTGQLAALTVETHARRALADQEATEELTTGSVRWDRWAAFGVALVGLGREVCQSWYGKLGLSILVVAMACRVLGLDVPTALHIVGIDVAFPRSVVAEEVDGVPGP
jgi:endonuclease III